MQHPQGKVKGEVLKIVLPGTFDADGSGGAHGSERLALPGRGTNGGVGRGGKFLHAFPMQERFRRFLHRFQLSPEHLQYGKVGKWLGRHGIHPDLWSFHRGPVARGFVAGILSGTSPFLGLHYALALVLAVGLRANVPTALVVQFANNPFTIPVYYAFAYRVGEKILDRPSRYEGGVEHSMKLLGETPGIRPKLRILAGSLAHAAVPLMLGCTLIGVVVAATAYGLIYWCWPPPPVPTNVKARNKRGHKTEAG
ncbi:MAG: DUF2062 domain-containing protein [Verrucomicrobia bacterium]|nr:DUF2062 domain-containing protein [Verrucomicrobiota bacterium]